MSRKYSVAILGNGRVARAAAYFFKRNPGIEKAALLLRDRDLKNYDLLVGALPGELGQRCLELALRYKKNLIDISDVDPPYYLKRKKEIARIKITVIPGCGFSPGLVNFILGKELSGSNGADSVEVKAGSLSRKKYFYPFLWCFEDIVVEHTIPSYQLIGGQKKKFPAFADYRKEKVFGIDAESYFCASGFENIPDKTYARNFTYRVVRPRGFAHFLNFVKNYGLLDKNNIANTKKIFESTQKDNFTFAEINFVTADKEVRWAMHAFSQKDAKFNSMQKMTASVPSVIGRMLLSGGIKKKGLLFMEELAGDDLIFQGLMRGIKKNGIHIRRSIREIKKR